MSVEMISLFSMLVSLMAMATQLVFGVLATRRATAETNRQIAETRKQEKLHALSVEETYKNDVRNWGQAVVEQMAAAQQLTRVDPAVLQTSDYDIKRAEIIGQLRGHLDKAQWLFPNLATPTRKGRNWGDPDKRYYSALETILYVYHEFDRMDASTPEGREQVGARIRKFRKMFSDEMRRAVDPHVRGNDIEKLMAQTAAAQEQNQDAPPEGEEKGFKALSAVEEEKTPE